MAPVPFQDSLFESPTMLAEFLGRCDALVHLAALNRHDDADELYRTNVGLVDKLIHALEASGSRPHVLFVSSVQEELDNAYGRSKRDGRERLAKWCRTAGARFTGLIVPNVFGPFCRPFYNSVVATFCYQVATGGEPEVHVDRVLDLLYVDDLVRTIVDVIRDCVDDDAHRVAHSTCCQVSDILRRLRSFDHAYRQAGVLPDLADDLDLCLFGTYLSHQPQGRYPSPLTVHTDARGSFTELLRCHGRSQVSCSTTLPGVRRGGHYHTRRVERFCVVRGEAAVRIRALAGTAETEFLLTGRDPAYIDIPPFHVHDLTNVGEDEMLCLFWINGFFDPTQPDTCFPSPGA